MKKRLDTILAKRGLPMNHDSFSLYQQYIVLSLINKTLYCDSRLYRMRRPRYEAR